MFLIVPQHTSSFEALAGAGRRFWSILIPYMSFSEVRIGGAFFACSRSLLLFRVFGRVKISSAWWRNMNLAVNSNMVSCLYADGPLLSPSQVLKPWHEFDEVLPQHRIQFSYLLGRAGGQNRQTSGLMWLWVYLQVIWNPPWALIPLPSQNLMSRGFKKKSSLPVLQPVHSHLEPLALQ